MEKVVVGHILGSYHAKLDYSRQLGKCWLLLCAIFEFARIWTSLILHDEFIQMERKYVLV